MLDYYVFNKHTKMNKIKIYRKKGFVKDKETGEEKYDFLVPMPAYDYASVGDWIDLFAAEDVKLKAGEFKIIDLGVAIEKPAHYEAQIVARSSMPKNFGCMIANSIGVIDQPYEGLKDWWKAPLLAFRDTEIKRGDRICQFRLQLSQKAPFYAKIKWLFSNRAKIVEVDNLSKPSRGGLGTSGK